jgi:ornithine cyclodeaminase/alanine dehydrogenase-like protein (mu-crystallin family)
MADHPRTQATRRICLVGAGNISQTHAEALRGVPGAEVVAVCDPNRDRAEEVAGANGIGKVFDSVEALVASDVKEELGWAPERDRAEFIRQALHVYGNPSSARPA